MERNILELRLRSMMRAPGCLVVALALAVVLRMGPPFAVAQEPAQDEHPAVTTLSSQSPSLSPEKGEDKDGEDKAGKTEEMEEDAFSDDLYLF